MTEKLKDYQVLDVFCGGTLYKVRHKVTNSIFAWKAYNCSAFSDEQIQNVDNEVKTLSKVLSGNLLRYYDTILHGPTKTLYFVLEYNSWQSVQELISLCKATDKHFTENFVWYTLLELARTCKVVEEFNFVTLKKRFAPEAIFVGPSGELRINCFELSAEASEETDLIQQVGEVIRTLCYLPGACDDKIKEFHYSDDLRDVISFLTDVRSDNLRPDVVIYHPTVLSNTDTLGEVNYFKDILTPTEITALTSESNKCDSEKAEEQCKVIEPLPRKHLTSESPIYCNISPKWTLTEYSAEKNSSWEPLSPTIAALALELPGYVPRSRKPYSEAVERYNGPQKVSEDTLSQQWMSRLIALREREESLNRRERNLIAKEIMNSPSVEIVSLDQSTKEVSDTKSNGITLPEMLTQASDATNWVSRRHQRRSCSVRTRPRRKSYAYEELDSSLSADNGDSSMIITAAKITKENMPRRNIFPEVSSKKVHFTSSNPFAESDESVTLTFYELEKVDSEGYQLPKQQETLVRDITKFKYLDLEKMTSEKRDAMHWSHASPSKQAKVAGNAYSDITNKSMRKAPSKTSLSSKGSNISKTFGGCSKNLWSNDIKVSENRLHQHTSSHRTQNTGCVQTPKVPTDLKKSKRKSILPFKTPFKFKTSTKV